MSQVKFTSTGIYFILNYVLERLKLLLLCNYAQQIECDN